MEAVQYYDEDSCAAEGWPGLRLVMEAIDPIQAAFAFGHIGERTLRLLAHEIDHFYDVDKAMRLVEVDTTAAELRVAASLGGTVTLSATEARELADTLQACDHDRRIARAAVRTWQEVTKFDVIAGGRELRQVLEDLAQRAALAERQLRTAPVVLLYSAGASKPGGSLDVETALALAVLFDIVMDLDPLT